MVIIITNLGALFVVHSLQFFTHHESESVTMETYEGSLVWSWFRPGPEQVSPTVTDKSGHFYHE